MLIYFYTFRGHQTHHDPKYFRRGKLGETDRKGELSKDSSQEEIYERVRQRIYEQKNASVSEPPVVLGYWFVESDLEQDVDAEIRKILYTQLGATQAWDEQTRNEWVIVPCDLEDDRISLVKEAILIYSKGRIAESVLEQRCLYQGTQDEAFANVCSEFDAGATKCLVIASCGIGKSTIEIALTEHATPTQNQVNVVFVPNIALANQILREFMSVTIHNREVDSIHSILVHSDTESVLNVIPTTDPLEIVRQLNNTTKPVWMFAVYDSTLALAEGIWLAKRSVHLKILDEVHRTASIGETRNTLAVRLKSNYQVGFSANFKIIR
jgi:hypothetical protein